MENIGGRNRRVYRFTLGINPAQMRSRSHQREEKENTEDGRPSFGEGTAKALKSFSVFADGFQTPKIVLVSY